MPTHSGSGHTISTPVTPIFLKHLNDLPEISLSSIPDVYQQYIQEKADKILQEIVPEPVDSERHNCVTQEDIAPGEQDTQHHLFPAQRMLHPLSRVSHGDKNHHQRFIMGYSITNVFPNSHYVIISKINFKML